MKRRTFLTAIGSGSAGAGALVGTGGYSRVESQRRVKIEVGEKPVLDLRGISFVAFCPAHPDMSIDIEIVSRNEDGVPVEIEWNADAPFTDEVILKGGSEWYRFEFENAESGTAIMQDPPGVLLCDECPDCVADDDDLRCPPSPCLDEPGMKFDYDEELDEFIEEDGDTATECPPGFTDCPPKIDP